jgi:spore germination protein YaaH
MRRFFVLWMLIFTFSGLRAQESIFEEINTILSDSKNKEEITRKKEASLLASDSSKQGEKDSMLLNANLQELQEADTVLFEKRMIEVKKPLTSKQLKSEEAWSKEFQIVNNVRYDKEHMLDTSYRVFGWHPYWSGNAYESYNFSLLSMISYFSYEVNPKTGFYNSIHNWRQTALVDSAKKYNCKVLLTLSNFGTNNNKIFLRSADAKKNLISTAITLVRERKADGLTLDFENVSAKEKTLYLNFIIDLATSLKSENKDYLLTIALPAVDFERVYDFSQINLYVDYYVMMGYEYHGSNSQLAGPVAPLTGGGKWKGFTLESSVDEYLANGVPAGKFIMGIPYYGAEWITKDLKFPSQAKSFVKYHSYRQAKRMSGKKMGEVDETSMSKFYTYSDISSNYRQVWFEDTITLGAKYDWIKEKQIRGVGIWALGFDNGYDELWKLLADKFAYSDKELKEIKKARHSISLRRLLGSIKRFVKNPMSVVKRPKALLRLFGGLTGISLVGLFLVFRYGRKFKRLFRLVLKGGVSAIVILAIALILIFFRYFDFRETMFLIGGFLLGGALFLFFTRRYTSEKELP